MSGLARVRRGGVADVDLLRAIRLEALADTPEAYGSTYAETVTWDAAQWLEVAGRWNFFLAELDARVVGLATGGVHERYPGTRWLFGMYVTPSARGTGVAELLVDAVGAWALGEGARELHLHVTERVPRARAFYERAGFRPTGEVASLGRDSSVGLVTMVKSLAVPAEMRVEEVDPARLWNLRRRVLRAGDPAARVDEPRDREVATLHLAALHDGEAVACASFFDAPDADGSPAFQLRFMAVDAR